MGWLILRQNLKRWVPVVSILVLLVVLTVIWYATFPPSVWADTPNYFGMYVGFVASQGLNAFLNVNTGPGGVIVALSFLPTYLLIGAHILLERFGKKMKWQFSIVNKYYLVYIVVLALFTISIQNASQHYNWYWNPELNAPGYVDTWTHILSPWLLGALIVPFALERYLGWDRRLMWFFMFAVLASVALLWEIAETSDVYLNPTPTYFNYPMDSIKDIIMGAGIGTILSTWFYENIVVHLSEKRP
jgi:hypothetical protein